jgi:hypothetical protein
LCEGVRNETAGKVGRKQRILQTRERRKERKGGGKAQ